MNNKKDKLIIVILIIALAAILIPSIIEHYQNVQKRKDYEYEQSRQKMIDYNIKNTKEMYPEMFETEK